MSKTCSHSRCKYKIGITADRERCQDEEQNYFYGNTFIFSRIQFTVLVCTVSVLALHWPSSALLSEVAAPLTFLLPSSPFTHSRLYVWAHPSLKQATSSPFSSLLRLHFWWAFNCPPSTQMFSCSFPVLSWAAVIKEKKKKPPWQNTFKTEKLLSRLLCAVLY